MVEKNNFDLNDETKWFKEFVDHVFLYEGLQDWTITAFHELFDGGACYNNVKTIEIDRLHTMSWYYLKELFLHEVAHALDPMGDRSSWVSHDPEFFRRYGELLIRYSQCQPKDNDNE